MTNKTDYLFTGTFIFLIGFHLLGFAVTGVDQEFQFYTSVHFVQFLFAIFGTILCEDLRSEGTELKELNRSRNLQIEFTMLITMVTIVYSFANDFSLDVVKTEAYTSIGVITWLAVLHTYIYK